MKFKSTTFKSTRPSRGLLGSAVGLTLLLLGAAACGTSSQSSSPANASAAPAAASATPIRAEGVAQRTIPSSAQVAEAIAQVKKRIPMSFQPNEDHVRAFGDAACKAFDDGRTAPQVRDLVMQAASQLQSIKVSSADADFAVGTAVNLFCPGYSARLAS